MFTKSMKLIALCLTAFLLTTANKPAAARTLDQIVSSGELRVGYIVTPPNVIRDPATGDLTGFDIDAIKEIANMMGLKSTKFIETTWGTFAAGLQADQFDVSIAGTFATVKRSMAVQFTRTIYSAGWGAVILKTNTRIKSLADMNTSDTRIAVVQGGSAEDYVRRNMPKAQLVTLATGDLTAGLVEVVAGRADVGIEDFFTVNNFVKQQPSIKNLYYDHPFNFTPIAWAVSKGNLDLVNVINTAINVLTLSGRYDDMARPYFKAGDLAVGYIETPHLDPFPRAVPSGE
jgi:polar amino acid transport system substrate-binding protein